MPSFTNDPAFAHIANSSSYKGWSVSLLGVGGWVGALINGCELLFPGRMSCCQSRWPLFCPLYRHLRRSQSSLGSLRRRHHLPSRHCLHDCRALPGVVLRRTLPNWVGCRRSVGRHSPLQLGDLPSRASRNHRLNSAARHCHRYHDLVLDVRAYSSLLLFLSPS